MKILVVDDKEEAIYFLTVLLEGNGYDVVSARHGAEALVKARRDPPDVIISDLLMPVMDGFTLLRLCKADATLQAVPFLVFTATYTEPEDAKLAINMGADDFLLKPAEPDVVMNKLREMIDRAHRPGEPVREHVAGDHRELLQVYNQTLVRKLEKKALELEESNRALALDIAEREKAEADLRLLRSAIVQTSESVIITDADLDFPGPRIVFVNPAFTENTGYSIEEVIGKSPRILQGPLTDRGVLDRLRRNLENGENFKGKTINYRKNGSPYHIEWRIAPLRDEAGRITHFVSIQQDITNRQRIEDELRWKTAFLETLVDTSIDATLVVDPNGRQILQNQTLRDLWANTSVLDDSFPMSAIAAQILAPSEFQKTIDQLGTDGVFRSEIDLVDHRVLDCFSAPVRDATGEYYGRIWTWRDITEMHNREKRLAVALSQEQVLSEKARAGDRAKSEFLAMMSHEIRTPLNSILGFSELLNMTPGLPSESREFTNTILSSGEALLQIIDDVLDFSRLEAGRLHAQKLPFSPADVLKNVQTVFAQQAAEKGIELRFEIDADFSRPFLGDAGRLRQILFNLVGNALKFTERGSIAFGMRKDDTGLGYEFFVKDTGVGIASAQKDLIFQPFTQADSSISRRHGGTGLGLTISRRLAEILGGTLTLQSEIGVGSEFTLRLQLEECAALPEHPKSASPLVLDAHFAEANPLRILIVEDDNINRKLLLSLIKKLGYQPLFAVNGRDALAIYQEHNPDCLLMDLQMPEMDGIEATQAIRAMEASRSEKCPVFISALTANIFPADRQRCIQAGMNAYLNKPIHLAALADTLRMASNTLSQQKQG